MVGPSNGVLRIAPIAFVMAIASGSAALAQLPPLVEQALAMMDETELDEWSYTVTTTRDGTKTVERHDAAKPANARWQLLLKNGESPTSDDLAEYDQSKNRPESQRSKRGEKDNDDRISTMIEPGSLSLLSEDETSATYRFKMSAEDEGAHKFTDHVRGTLVIDKSLPFIKRIQMQSTDEIRPAIGVRISEFNMEMSFESAEGAVLPGTIATRVKGRAFLFKSLDEDISVTFSDYKRSARVGAEARPEQR